MGHVLFQCLFSFFTEETLGRTLSQFLALHKVIKNISASDVEKELMKAIMAIRDKKIREKLN